MKIRSAKFTHFRLKLFLGGAIGVACCAVPARLDAAVRRVAVLSPDATALSRQSADAFRLIFVKRFRVPDLEMAAAAYGSVQVAAPFNMTTGEARAVANVVGCDAFALIKAETLRRSSLDRPEYYEAYLSIYLVNGRTGELVDWRLSTFTEATPAAAAALLSRSLANLAVLAADRLARVEFSPPSRPPNGFPVQRDGVENLKPPIPYKRIKPEYPRIAYLYGIRATVEIEADIDESGAVANTSITRWAGFGLDEAATAAVRVMNWRPAMQNDKALPMRVLLRYNFTRIEKE